jgi:1,4-dihydroxy-2-naphthoyl-CoA hydrolase
MTKIKRHPDPLRADRPRGSTPSSAARALGRDELAPPTTTTEALRMTSIPNTFEPGMAAAMFGPVGEMIGLSVDEVSGDTMVARWTVSPQVHQPAGLLHGGNHCWIHETLASVAGAVWFGDQGQVVGVSNQTDFFRAVRAGELRSVATPLHRGRSQQVWVVESRDGDDRLVARGQVRLQNLTPPQA